MDAEYLKSQIDLTAHAKRLGLVMGKGRTAHCPNTAGHKDGDDKNPSLVFSKNNRSYNCKACGMYGTVIDLHMLIKGLNFTDAIEDLAKMYNITDTDEKRSKKPYKARSPQKSEDDTNTQPDPQTPQVKPIRKDYSGIYQALLDYCGKITHQPVLDYLTGEKRGLAPETITRFSLFYISDYQATSKHLADKFPMADLQESGLFNDKGHFLFYVHPIVIPYFDLNNKITCLRGRYFHEGSFQPTTAKMLSLIGVPMDNLYNIATVKTMNDGDPLYIVEGEFDAMIAEQSGVRAVAVPGMTHWNAQYAQQLKHYDIRVCLDNPKPGQNDTDTHKERVNIIHAVNRIAESFEDIAKEIKVCTIPGQFKDITDYFCYHNIVPF